jgi:hypothetical protein
VTSIERQQPIKLPHSWQSDIRLWIWETCGNILDTSSVGSSLFISHTHKSVADFQGLPEARSRLLLHAGWQESDIQLAFCRIYVSSCELYFNTSKEYPFPARHNFDNFMLHAAQYDSHSGKPCAELIYKLDSVFRSRPLALGNDDLNHWIHSAFAICNPEWAVPEAHALLFCAVIYGLRLFVERAIVTLTNQAVVVDFGDLLPALVLGCYYLHESRHGISAADAITLLCSRGASPNDTVRRTLTSKQITAQRLCRGQSGRDF